MPCGEVREVLWRVCRSRAPPFDYSVREEVMITGLGGAAQTPGFVVLRTNDITGDSGNVSIATRKDPEGNLVQLLQLPGARG